MSIAKPVTTPFASHFRLSAKLSPQTEDDERYMSRVPYANTVDIIMYMIVCTRSDISYAVSVVSRYMDKPKMTH